MLLSAFTLFHVLLSLVGIGSGLLVLYGFLVSKWFSRSNTLFLVTTVATSVTGFLFPFHHFTPGIAVGILSLVVLAVSIVALYRFRLVGGWCKTYIITAALALYFNVFVLIAQLFQKIPSLKALAPTQTEPPFQATQLVILVVFVVLAIRATMKFHKEPQFAV